MTFLKYQRSRSSEADSVTEIEPLRNKSEQSIFISSAKTAEIYMKEGYMKGNYDIRFVVGLTSDKQD